MIVRIVLDIRTLEDPASVVLDLERYLSQHSFLDGEVVAASGVRLEAGEPQVGAENVG